MQNLPHVIFSISLRAVIFALCPGVTDLQFAAGKHYKQPAASMTCDPRRGGFHMCQFIILKQKMRKRERERNAGLHRSCTANMQNTSTLLSVTHINGFILHNYNNINVFDYPEENVTAQSLHFQSSGD